VLGRNGNIIRPITKLTNNATATLSTDWGPSVAVAPNGTIGVAWYRRLDSSDPRVYKATTEKPAGKYVRCIKNP
jgi:hypothetical protein